MIETKYTVKSPFGHNLSATVTLPDESEAASLILLLHGYSSKSDNKGNLALAPILAEGGIASVRFDFEGHGDSGGSTEHLTIGSGAADAEAVLSAAFNIIPSAITRLSIVASSFGGSVALRMLATNKAFHRIAFRAPVSDYCEVRRNQLGVEGLKEWRETGFAIVDGSAGPKRSPYAFWEDAAANDVYKAAANIPVPLLVLHGTNDGTVPISQSRRLVSAWGGPAELKEVSGADHGFSKPEHLRLFAQECAHFVR